MQDGKSRGEDVSLICFGACLVKMKITVVEPKMV